MMTDKAIEIALRIPGRWSGPQELADRVPADYSLRGDRLIAANGSEFELVFREPDDRFASVVRQSCRTELTEDEADILDNYTVQVCLLAPGGAVSQAVEVMQAAAALLYAGGGGVFIDNSAMSFGASRWCEMAETADIDAVSFAFVNIVQAGPQAYTVGMHVLGQPDLHLSSDQIDQNGHGLVELIQEISQRETRFVPGDLLILESGRSFLAMPQTVPPFGLCAAMENPWGRFKLVNAKQIAEQN